MENRKEIRDKIRFLFQKWCSSLIKCPHEISKPGNERGFFNDDLICNVILQNES